MAGRFSVESIFKAVDKVTAPVSRMQRNVLRFTRATERGLRKANDLLGRFTSRLASGGASLLKWGAASAAAFGYATLRAINKVADSLDPLAKQSRRLQFPIEDLQEWKFVAEQSGVSNELLGKSLGAFSKRLGEAKAGTGPLVAGLKKLNPQLLKQLNSADSISDAFNIYINAMRNAKTATEKAALANAAFSRAGLQMVDISMNSSAAIEALRKEQRENGVVTMEQAEAAEAYNDAMNSLQRSWGGLLQTVLVPMLPKMTAMLRTWREWIVANRLLIATRVNEFVAKAKEVIGGLVDQVRNLNGQYSLLDRLIQVVNGLADSFAFLREHGATIAKIVASVVALSLALKVLTAVMAVVNIVMAANPIGLIVLAITALIAAIAAAIIWWDEIKAAFLSLPGPVKAALAVLAGPIGWLIGAASLIYDNWEPIKGFFSSLWDGVVGIFDSAVNRITGVVDRVKNAASSIVDTISSVGGGVAKFFGFGGDEEDDARKIQERAQVVSPQERTAQLVEERRTTSTAEVTIKDDTGRAEVTRGSLGAGVQLQPSGAF